RTMLRALRVTPDTDLPPPRADQAPALRAAAAAVVAPAPMRGALALALGAGTRAGAPAASVAFDGNAAAIWRPDALGLALTGQYTPSHERTAGTFAGTASDEAVGLVARLPIALGVDRLRVVAMAGGALHVITLRGTIAAGTGVAETSYDPAVRAGAALEYALDPTVDVGVSAVADYLVQRQRYDVDASEILLIPRAQLEVAVVLTLRLL
ncbi:MAG TPA: hypothetical protein VLX92_03730, partial [Kofleriaceae bacterium]|nr:hypothetical protein [Kofleriaceae bacterium]